MHCALYAILRILAEVAHISRPSIIVITNGNVVETRNNRI